MTTTVAKSLQRLLAIAKTGLVYAKTPYDKERYQDILEQVGQLSEQLTTLDSSELTELLRPTTTYNTPLVDVRAFIVKDDKVLLVKDRLSQEGWALPGGFCEVGFSPQANVLKEVKEETGYAASVRRLLAVFDTNQWQLQSKQYVKLVYHCELGEGHFVANHEVSDLAYFSMANLPQLSTKRVTAQQLTVLWECYCHDTTYSD